MSQRLPPFTADYLLQSLNSLPEAQSYLLGFSGGADSTALLHALMSLQGKLSTPVRAVHVNHGLHPHAAQWQQHCETTAHAWSVPITCLTVKLKGNGKGLEAEARDLRYQAVQSIMKPGECLLTAHHADDQAETLLLNLLRGSGVDGLSAMPARKRFGQHWLLRPLLDVTGHALREYLQTHDLKWLEDPSNSRLDQDRNFVRHEVLPLLESRFEGITQRLLLTRQSMFESRGLLETVADQYLHSELPHPLVLNANSALLESPALFKLVVRRWLAKAELPGIPGRLLNELYEQMNTAGMDHQVAVRWAGCAIRVYQNQLYVHTGSELSACTSQHWPDGQAALELDHGLGRMIFESLNPLQLPGSVTVVNRQMASGLTLAQANHHQSLKNLFQSAHIPVWLRDSIPLILLDNQLAAVGDWDISRTFASWMNENHVKFTWQPEASILQYISGYQHE